MFYCVASLACYMLLQLLLKPLENWVWGPSASRDLDQKAILGVTVRDWYYGALSLAWPISMVWLVVTLDDLKE